MTFLVGFVCGVLCMLVIVEMRGGSAARSVTESVRRPRCRCTYEPGDSPECPAHPACEGCGMLFPSTMGAKAMDFLCLDCRANEKMIAPRVPPKKEE